jgi:hypothetical protein
MKTNELTGAVLDWAAAKCEGVSVRWSAAHEQLLVEGYPYMVWQPSTNWSQGGPIIEREGISVDRTGLAWTADISDSVGGYIEHTESGPTPLIAVMRCYVASKMGAEIHLPMELTK